ncbi:MAG: hypothetical protein MUE85_11290 [Microscillaceae bacterium]|jgi:hypothetical protein|nr:hypothetical protein [Microscillaceae bacterium]
MPNTSLLFDDVVAELLLTSMGLDDGGKPFIKFLVQPTFTNHFLLQFTWNRQQLHWGRSTWLRNENPLGYRDWFDNLPKDEWQLDLRIMQESGTSKSEIIGELIPKIAQLSVSPSLENGRLGRDGDRVQLTIGNPSMQIDYSWCTASSPDSWGQLDEIYPILLSINQQFIALNQEFVTAKWQLGEGQHAWAKLISLEPINGQEL